MVLQQPHSATLPAYFDARHQLANCIQAVYIGQPYLVKKRNHPHIHRTTPDAEGRVWTKRCLKSANVV